MALAGVLPIPIGFGPEICQVPSSVDAHESSQIPVQVVNGKIIFHPAQMELNRYYFVVFNGKPYLYRKLDEEEIEIYGLAE